MEREEQDRELEEILKYYKGIENPGSQDNLVTLLREIQEVYGCIPSDLQQIAADTAEVKLSSVTCIMKLYKSLKPAAYSHKITVCTGPRCAAKNQNILETVKKELNIGADGLSRDKTIFLDMKNCMKQCRTAPNMMIDGIMYPYVNAGEVKKVLEKVLNMPIANT